MSEELRECPFCGHSASLDENGFVSCDGIECQARGPFTPYDEQSISAWNRRTAVARVERMEKVVEAVALRLDADPHQWSKRPCQTCADITNDIGRDFGCVAYSKSALTYSDYGKVARGKLASLSPEKAKSEG